MVTVDRVEGVLDNDVEPQLMDSESVRARATIIQVGKEKSKIPALLWLCHIYSPEQIASFPFMQGRPHTAVSAGRPTRAQGACFPPFISCQLSFLAYYFIHSGAAYTDTGLSRLL